MYLKDVKTEDLSALQETWQGRLRKDRAIGKLVRQRSCYRPSTLRGLKPKRSNRCSKRYRVSFPNIAQAAMAFVLIQRYGGLRLVDVVTLRTDSFREDGLMIVSQEKNEQRSSCLSRHSS